MKSRQSDGFSLVELSIVLVILGLLTGGILGGQALMNAAELRRIPNNISKYTIAVNTFKDKYLSLPGDFTKASSFWLDATDCTAALAPAGCDGNGNGMLDHEYDPAFIDEGYRFWQHLSYAGLIEGSYSGQRIGNTFVAGENVPESVKGASVTVHSMQAITMQDFGPQPYPAHYAYMVGKRIPDGSTTNWWRADTPGGGFLTPNDAWNIDLKTDDGQANLGKVRFYHRSMADWGTTDCSTDNTNNVADFDWNLTNDTAKCNIVFF